MHTIKNTASCGLLFIALALCGGTTSARPGKSGPLERFVASERKLARQGRMLAGGRSFHWQHRRSPAKGAVFFAHGFSKRPREAVEVAKRVYRAGFDVFVLRHAGHGLSTIDGRPNLLATPTGHDYQRYSKRARRAFQLFRAHYASSGLPLHAVGLSAGGLATADVAARYPGALRQVHLHAPFFAPAGGKDRVVARVSIALDRASFGLFGRILDRVPLERSAPAFARPGAEGRYNLGHVLALLKWSLEVRQGLRKLARHPRRPRVMLVTTAVDDQADNGTAYRALRGQGAELFQFTPHAAVPHAMWRGVELDAAGRKRAASWVSDLIIGQLTGQREPIRQLERRGIIQRSGAAPVLKRSGE